MSLASMSSYDFGVFEKKSGFGRGRRA